jgi:hypothetical protein
MALTPKLLAYRPIINPDHAIVQFVASGNYPNPGGDTANLNPSSWSDPNGKGLLGDPLNPTTVPPSIETENIGGYYAQFVPGTTLANGKIHFYASEGSELANGAYPAAISGGVLTVKVPL